MPRRFRLISLVVVILIAVFAYRFYGAQNSFSKPPGVQPSPAEPAAPVTPQQSSTVPTAPLQPPTIPGESHPNGEYPYYLGISDKQMVTIYRWENGSLVLVSETPLSSEKLRQEEKLTLSNYLGVSSEEEAWQRIEGLSH